MLTMPSSGVFVYEHNQRVVRWNQGITVHKVGWLEYVHHKWMWSIWRQEPIERDVLLWCTYPTSGCGLSDVHTTTVHLQNQCFHNNNSQTLAMVNINDVSLFLIAGFSPCVPQRSSHSGGSGVGEAATEEGGGTHGGLQEWLCCHAICGQRHNMHFAPGILWYQQYGIMLLTLKLLWGWQLNQK